MANWENDKMKVLIVSDNHGRLKQIKSLLKQVAPIDLMIHLGDIGDGADHIKYIAPCPVEMVAGNTDFFYINMAKEKILQIGKFKVMITHGHEYGVNYSTSSIEEAAIKNKADIVMFGHTHVPMIDTKGKVSLINPGSISLPRQSGRIPTFIIMDIDSKGNARFTLKHLDELE